MVIECCKKTNLHQDLIVGDLKNNKPRVIRLAPQKLASSTQ